MRLIDADKLLEKVYTIENGGVYGDCEVVDRYEIENAPTVSENGLIAEDYIKEKMFFVKRECDKQPIPVIAVKDLVAFERPRGKWAGINEYINHLEEETGERYRVSSVYDGSIFCNQCWQMNDKKSCFCPNCGAEMKTKEN